MPDFNRFNRHIPIVSPRPSPRMEEIGTLVPTPLKMKNKSTNIPDRRSAGTSDCELELIEVRDMNEE